MDNQFEPLSMGEVLSVDESAQIFIGHRTFRVGELSQAISKQLESGSNGWTADKKAWFSEEGVLCEVLRFNSRGWQKGKVRISVEFCPQEAADEVQSASASLEDELAVAAPAREEQPDQLESPVLMEDELDLGELPSSSEVELDLGELPSSSEAEELFELGTVAAAGTATAAMVEELEQEAPSEASVEMEQEAATSPEEGDEFDFGEISDSIEQDLEFEEVSAEGDDELMDLGEVSAEGNNDLGFGEMSAEGNDELNFGEMSAESDDELNFGEMSAESDDDLDFGEMSAESDDDLDFGEMSAEGDDELMDLGEISAEGNDDLDFDEMSVEGDEFDLEDISSNKELENSGSDSLLDDVWQDINEAN